MFECFQILQSEGESQMSIITQASNALSLCRSTKEFYGSAEQVNSSCTLNKLRWYLYYITKLQFKFLDPYWFMDLPSDQ